MELLEGLTSKQIALIRHCLTNRRFEKGDIVFREGDPADCFYVIISGGVEILRETEGKPIRLAKLGANDVFGEMAMLINAGRTAAARAMEPTLAYEVPTNLVEAMKKACGAAPTTKFLQNLVCILAERQRAKHTLAARAPRSLVLRRSLTVARDMESALEIVKKSLPKGATRWLAPKKRLDIDEYLCKEDDKSDGFYFIHEGALAVENADRSGRVRKVGTMTAPIIAGEYGFFTGAPRTASLRADQEAVYTHFPAAHFDKLRSKYPDEAMNVLFAVARLAAYLLAEE